MPQATISKIVLSMRRRLQAVIYANEYDNSIVIYCVNRANREKRYILICIKESSKGMATITISEKQPFLKGWKRKLKSSAAKSQMLSNKFKCQELELVFPPETFQSVYLSQQSITQQSSTPYDETSKEWKDAVLLKQSIFSDPQLVITSCDQDIVDLEFIKGKKFEKIEPSDSRYIHMDTDPSKFSSPFCRPYALTYVIQTESKGVKPCLSRQDLSLLNSSRNVKAASDSIVYVVQNTPQNQNYTAEDLLLLSNEIEEVFKLPTNTAYKNIFLETDAELFIRLGLIMQNNILKGMKSLRDILSILNNQSKHIRRHPMETRAARPTIEIPQNRNTHYMHPVQQNPDADYITTLQNLLGEEIPRICNNVQLHAWKILSFRNTSVHAFGFVKGVVRIYLNESTSKTDVKNYFKKFLNQSSLDFTMQEWPTNFKMTKYAYEQGSRVDKTATHTAGNDNIKYGTLGMFLENTEKELFFTTCAHVIEEGESAFCPNDHSILGKSVFACEGPSTLSNHWLDVSLVKVDTPNISDCACGLKGPKSACNFFQYKIFSGSLDDILSRQVYKWGARTEYTEGIFESYIVSENESDQPIFLDVDIGSSSFAQQADSGSIVCLSSAKHVPDDPSAVLVIFGGREIPVGDQMTPMLVCYKLADAIEEIKLNGSFGEDIRPCVVTGPSRQITSTSRYDPKQATQPTGRSRSPPGKRQKMLPPRTDIKQ
ncbi:unnamed protein product [Mytilus coruscus]|uniref:Uncharacterized protein n=1 Tax=Mytilus coruscus TaxID=42192 RepID=A0A6J8BUG7_MYTCO|nr:unnamed protein product [Mytilus coruscus]